MTDAVQLSLFGRTSSEPSHQLLDTTSLPSSIRWPRQGRWTLSGECWMRSGSESPNADAACSSLLVSILEEEVDARFFLTAQRCTEIMERAERRGRVLPPDLMRGLTLASMETDPPEA